MRWARKSRPFTRVVVAVALVAGGVSMGAAPAQAAGNVTGGGSTWAQLAIDQWRADIARQGLSVNYQGVGGPAGRDFYIRDQVDFAVALRPFSNAERPRAAHRPFTHVPLVAGATAFMFRLDIDGQRLRDLQLGPDTLAGIFTGEITNWNDARISADLGRTLPSLPIIPVVRADGADSTAHVTEWFAKAASATWQRYCQRVFISPCGPVSVFPNGTGVAQSTSDGVASYVVGHNGAITYVAPGFAEQRGFPMASVRNATGRYMPPSIGSTLSALLAVRMDDDGAPILDDVYASPRWNAYPLATYASAIVPTTTAAPFTSAKGATLGRFLSYSVCTGQAKAKPLGYAPLPPALVKIALQRITRIPGASAPPAKNCIPNRAGWPQITPGTATVTEGNSGTKTIDIPFSLSRPVSRIVTADWITVVPSAASPWAQPPSDYGAARGTISFAPGETNATVSLVINGDRMNEPDELVVVSLQYATARLGGFYGLGIGTIQNDDSGCDKGRPVVVRDRDGF